MSGWEYKRKVFLNDEISQSNDLFYSSEPLFGSVTLDKNQASTKQNTNSNALKEIVKIEYFYYCVYFIIFKGPMHALCQCLVAAWSQFKYSSS